MSSSNATCVACKYCRKKCTEECVLWPYFPPDKPEKYICVHKVFGNSNLTKLITDIPLTQRQEAVNSLIYEAEARLMNPVYGCIGYISLLQKQLKQVESAIRRAKNELATYIGPAAFGPMLDPPQGNIIPPASAVNSVVNAMPQSYGNMMGMGMMVVGPSQGGAIIRDAGQRAQQQQLEAQQMAMAVAAREQQEMMRNWNNYGNNSLFKYSGGDDGYEDAMTAVGGGASGSGYNPAGSPSQSLGGTAYDLNTYQQQHEPWLLLQQPAQHHQQQQLQQLHLLDQQHQPHEQQGEEVAQAIPLHLLGHQQQQQQQHDSSAAYLLHGNQ